MARKKEERIDRSKTKDPREVSGWGEGRQDFSDIARHSELNPEFEQQPQEKKPPPDAAD